MIRSGGLFKVRFGDGRFCNFRCYFTYFIPLLLVPCGPLLLIWLHFSNSFLFATIFISLLFHQLPLPSPSACPLWHLYLRFGNKTSDRLQWSLLITRRGKRFLNLFHFPFRHVHFGFLLRGSDFSLLRGCNSFGLLRRREFSCR